MDVIKRLIAILRVFSSGDVTHLLIEMIERVKNLHNYVSQWRHPGVYEVLEHDTTVELVDPSGRLATVERRQMVRFLDDNLVAFTDYAWGDGNTLVDYSCSPGVPVDVYDDGAKQTILISLRETKNRGDTLHFKIQRKILRGFMERDEWWETEIYHRTQHMKVAIIFPSGRRCQRAIVTQRSTNRTIALGPEHFRFLGDGRQELTWEMRHPKLHDRYTLKWRW